MRTLYDKLIRDRIPDIMDEAGVAYEIAEMSEAAYRKALRQKLVEEAHEVVEATTPHDLAKELADLLEVVQTVMSAEGLDARTIGAVRRARRDARGGFERKLRLLWTEEASSNP